jgi:hypothetical protein
MLALFLAVSALACASSISVEATVTPGSGVFHYEYSMANTTADDVLLIDIPVPADPLAVRSLTAPSGFLAAFDSGLGLVSFLDDTALFGATAQAGSSYDSLYVPGPVTFQGTAVTADEILHTLKGATVAPVSEPGYLAPLALLSAATLAVAHFNRRVTRAGVTHWTTRRTDVQRCLCHLLRPVRATRESRRRIVAS